MREGVKFYRLCKVLFIVSGRAGVMSAQAEDRLGRNRVYGVNRVYRVCAWVRKDQSPLISVFYRLFPFFPGGAGVMSAQAEDRLGRNRVYGVCAWVRKDQSPLISVFYRLFPFPSVLSRQSRGTGVLRTDFPLSADSR